MTVPEDQLWTLGGLSYEDGVWRVTTAKELSRERFEELRQKTLFVSRLAEQREFRRLLDAVARWSGTVERETEVLVSRRLTTSQAPQALVFDLVAVAHAARRVEGVLSEEVASATDAPAELVHTFTEIRHRVRAMPNYLLTHELARQASEEGIEVMLVDDVLYLGKSRALPARNVPVGLLGSFYWLVSAHIAIFERRVEEMATDIESAAATVTGGMPHLIVFTDRSQLTGPMSFTELPLPVIAALRGFFRERRRALTPEEAVTAAMTLARATTRAELTVAGVGVTGGMFSSSAGSGVNELPQSRFKLDLDLLGSTPVEYWGAVHYSIAQGDLLDQMFAGAVQSVSVDRHVASLVCEGAIELTEHNARGLIAANVSSGELFRSIALQAGLPADVIPISESVGEQPEEEFEVVAPVRGMEVPAPVSVGPVTIVPRQQGVHALDGLPLDSEAASELEQEFLQATSYALARPTATALDEAEDLGWAALEVAIAWLAVRGRYGLARVPSGQVHAFSRHEALRPPRVADVIVVRGIRTGRQWLRSRGPHPPVDRMVGTGSAVLDPPLPTELTSADRQAVLALSRATVETIVESQLQALWEAIEYYAARTRVRRLFSPQELERLRELIGGEFRDAQADALNSAIENLNAAPLLVRLDHRLKEDGVPLGDDDRRLLFGKLRRARNDTAHGRAVRDKPTRDEILRGIAIVARMLVYRISRDAQ
jgi:hypothetical protein